MSLRLPALVRFLALLVVFLATTGRAAGYGRHDLAPSEVGGVAYHPLVLTDDGRAPAAMLEQVVRGLRPEVEAQRAQVVVLIHGFNTTVRGGRERYELMAARVREEAEPLGLRLAVVGVHWDSYPGSGHRWLPAVAGSRVLSGLGFRKAIRNPYLDKVRTSRQVGRSGLRALFFAIQDAFPGTPVHLLAHSLGGESVVRALAPESGPREEGEPPVEQPARTLSLGLVAIAGADVDHDVFAASAAAALPRAGVWWITVPEESRADAVLELRRAAGRRDAMGNQGLTLARSDFDALMARGALVVDDAAVPVKHTITDYFDVSRTRKIAAALLYLSRPAGPMAQGSELAMLDRLRELPAADLPSGVAPRNASERLYLRWRLRPGSSDFGTVRIGPITRFTAGE